MSETWRRARCRREVGFVRTSAAARTEPVCSARLRSSGAPPCAPPLPFGAAGACCLYRRLGDPGLTPGPDITFFLYRTIAQSRAAGFAALSGARTGLVVHTVLVAAGLSVLLAASVTAFTVLKSSARSISPGSPSTRSGRLGPVASSRNGRNRSRSAPSQPFDGLVGPQGHRSSSSPSCRSCPSRRPTGGGEEAPLPRPVLHRGRRAGLRRAVLRRRH